MINVVLYQPEIPGNTGNIMRTCAATNTKLHLIKPLGFSLEEKYIKRSAVNYIDKVNYEVYESFEDFLSKNEGEFYFLTRYGKKPHTSFDYSDKTQNIYKEDYRTEFSLENKEIQEYLKNKDFDPLLDSAKVVYVAYLCGFNDDLGNALSEEEFLEELPMDLTVINQIVADLINPKKK